MVTKEEIVERYDMLWQQDVKRMLEPDRLGDKIARSLVRIGAGAELQTAIGARCQHCRLQVDTDTSSHSDPSTPQSRPASPPKDQKERQDLDGAFKQSNGHAASELVTERRECQDEEAHPSAAGQAESNQMERLRGLECQGDQAMEILSPKSSKSRESQETIMHI